ncbi:hypothetical protein CEXT_657061 [Caerostris extrusa]|uniref:Uncharacterized protein n=1 Tax=Caerostris extrusa TaxID=172846 RepID=A0AAV4M6C0_CAEEX|nr:hypothetical protein CEXT_657061 [Caerostris extrusa]
MALTGGGGKNGSGLPSNSFLHFTNNSLSDILFFYFLRAPKPIGKRSRFILLQTDNLPQVEVPRPLLLQKQSYSKQCPAIRGTLQSTTSSSTTF